MGYEESLIKLKRNDMKCILSYYDTIERILEHNQIEIFSVINVLKEIPTAYANSGASNIYPGIYLWVGGERRGVSYSSQELFCKCDKFDVSDEYYTSSYNHDDIMNLLENKSYGLEYQGRDNIEKFIKDTLIDI